MCFINRVTSIVEKVLHGLVNLVKSHDGDHMLR